MLRFRFSIAAILSILAACRSTGPGPAIEPELAVRVPLGSTALAFLDLDQLRASPLFARLPANFTALLEPFRNAHAMVLALRNGEVLAIARGPVPGATSAPRGIFLVGSPALITASTVPHLPAALLTTAEPIARGHAIWIAAQGGVALPLTGNLANINTLLRDTETATLTLDLHEPMTAQLTAHCTSPASALHFEQTVRAIISLTAATTRKQPGLAGLWNAIELTHDVRVVRATASISAEALADLLR